MTYSNTLSATSPPDTDPVSQGDDAIRSHIAGIRERLATLVVDVDADPLVLKPDTVDASQIKDSLGLRKIIFGNVSFTIGAGIGGISATTAVTGATTASVVACNWAPDVWTAGYAVGGYVGSPDNVTVEIYALGDPTAAPGISSTIYFAVIVP